MKKIEIKIIRAYFKDLEQQVEEYLNKGYEIQGEFINDGSSNLYVILIRKN